jgi:hypothetical protein
MNVDVSPVGGGVVEINGEEAECYPQTVYVPEKTYHVPIEAIPAPGYCFVGWSGEDAPASEDENPYILATARDIGSQDDPLIAVFAPECIEYGSHNGTIQVNVPYGTMNKDGDPSPKVDFTVLDEAPQSDDAVVLGDAYRLGPAGATFRPVSPDRPVTMTWSFDPADIPEGVAAEDLTLAYYDESHNQWVTLDSTIDKKTGTISAPIDHLSIYAILAPTEAPPPEAAFSLSKFTIRTREATGEPAKPITVKPDETVYADVFVQNTTDTAGSCTVTLEIDGNADKYQKVTLGAGGFAMVTFETSRSQSGTYTVTINGLDAEASFMVVDTVRAPEAASLSPTQPTAPVAATSGAKARVLAPVIAAIVLAIFIPIKIRRRNRDWY